MSKLQIKKMIISALFLALGLILPFLTGQIPEIGSMLLPMHIPVILCGFVCGGWWGLAVGFICPLLRHVIFTMPPMPAALAMAFELGTYGLLSGLFYNLMSKTGSRLKVIVPLLIAMVIGRIVWGLVMMFIGFANTAPFTWAAFAAGAVTSAIPGIILQIVLIPLLLVAFEKAHLIPLESRENI